VGLKGGGGVEEGMVEGLMEEYQREPVCEAEKVQTGEFDRQQGDRR
jgi:hypothetical protein